MMGKDNLRDGRVRNWFYLENDLLDREDLSIYEKIIYIVVARYVDKENKAFPSIPTIAKKGSMSARQVQTIINSLIKKGLIKREPRINKHNKSKTSNLYTLLSVEKVQLEKDEKKGVVHDMHHPGAHGAPPLVNEVHPNNTSIKKTNLNNVNRASREEAVENSREEIKGEKTGSEEDINDIRKKIRKSLGEKKKESISAISSPEEVSNPEDNYSEKCKTGKYFHKDRRSAEKERLAKEIAEEMDDDHSLGAFRSIVDKISEQQIRIFFSIIKDTHLTGKIKRNKGAMFISLAKAYTKKNSINLNFK